MSSRVRAILGAQWRCMWHLVARPAGGRILAGILWLFWYGLWAFLGVAAGIYAALASRANLESGLPAILMGTCLFWQLAPILTTDAGASLNVRKILLYPISDGELFVVELLLRLTTALEVLLVLAGTGIGLAANPAVPRWLPAPALLIFVTFNLFLSAGLRSLLERLLAIRRVRELVVLLMVSCAALPQLLGNGGRGRELRRLFSVRQSVLLPWAAAAHLALGNQVVWHLRSSVPPPPPRMPSAASSSGAACASTSRPRVRRDRLGAGAGPTGCTAGRRHFFPIRWRRWSRKISRRSPVRRDSAWFS